MNENNQCETISFFIQGYDMIGNKGYCEHVSGELPYLCYRDGVSSQSCEDHCTSGASCIAYYYHKYGGCYLIPSKKSCPSGFIYGLGPIAASINELKAHSHPDYVCYGKV